MTTNFFPIPSSIFVIVPSTTLVAPYFQVVEHIADDLDKIHEAMHVTGCSLHAPARDPVDEGSLELRIARSCHYQSIIGVPDVLGNAMH